MSKQVLDADHRREIAVVIPITEYESPLDDLADFAAAAGRRDEGQISLADLKNQSIANTPSQVEPTRSVARGWNVITKCTASLLVAMVTGPLAIANAREEERFFIKVAADGTLTGDVVRQEKAAQIPAGEGSVAEASVQRSTMGDFCEILACHRAQDWSKASDPLKFSEAVRDQQRLHLHLDGLPAPASLAFILEADARWEVLKAGHFRCFLCTDPSAFFTGMPTGNFVLVNLDLEKKMRTKKLTVSPGVTRLQKKWDDLEDSRIDEKALRRHIELRRLPSRAER